MKKGFKQLVFLCMASLFSPFAAYAADIVQDAQIIQVQSLDWKEFHSVVGKCTLKFPTSPEHISEKMNVPEEGYDLKYDAYISSQDKKSVYMLLIAEYPEFVDQSLAQASLEGFFKRHFSK